MCVEIDESYANADIVLMCCAFTYWLPFHKWSVASIKPIPGKLFKLYTYFRLLEVEFFLLPFYKKECINVSVVILKQSYMIFS